MSHIDNTKIEAYDFPYDQSSFGQSNVDQKSLNPEEMIEEAARKREHRLIKNREAARECRRKKKEYIKVFAPLFLEFCDDKILYDESVMTLVPWLIMA